MQMGKAIKGDLPKTTKATRLGSLLFIDLLHEVR
jgi:hypothetical protein